MRMIEVNLFPVMPQYYAQRHNQEVTSMSDYADTGRRSRGSSRAGTSSHG